MDDEENELDSFEENHTIFKRKYRRRNSLICCVCTLATVAAVTLLLIGIGFGCGIIIGWKLLGSQDSKASLDWGLHLPSSSSDSLTDWLTGKLNPENVKSNLRTLTSKPHISGKEGNMNVTQFLYHSYLQNGFDIVETANYSVLLSYVNHSNYNTLELLQDDGNTLLYSAGISQEQPLTKGENDPNVPPPFNAYSAAGEAIGRLVYVNYGRRDDFLFLTTDLNLNLTDRVCIARYGKIFRGDKARLAEKFGCLGLIIYSDPQDYGGSPVYPDGPWLPPGGVQRGSVMITDGDPLTPQLPAIDGVYRRSYKEFVKSGGAPSIPVQPISYKDALHFLNQIDTISSPAGWKGSLNVSYMIYQSDNNTNLTSLKVNNIFEQREISNVFAVLYGSVEPDHLVILGNHYDAWTFGAVDPNSGTAVILELANVIGQLIRTGWRPGRTIVLSSWDCEEYGLIGSSEWIEDVEKVLGANAVAYLNTDIAVSGRKYFSANASPLMFDIIYDATKSTSSPNDTFNTVYDQWKNEYPDMTEPKINSLGSGSDFTYFIQSVGVTSMDMSYNHDINGYPVYHSVHDNFYWSSHFGDPTYTYHTAIGEVWLRVAMTIATTPLIPFNPVRYSDELNKMYQSLEQDYGDKLRANNISTDLLQRCLTDFQNAAHDLQNDIERFRNTTNFNILRIINNKLLNIERSFIVPEGLPGRPYFKHVISAPSSVNSYSGASFSSVVDAMFDAKTVDDWNFVHEQLDIVAIHIRYAAQIMNQPGVQWVKS